MPALIHGLALGENRPSTWIVGSTAQLGLDSQQLIVLRHAIRAAQGASFDLTRAGADSQIRNGSVLCFT